MTAPAGGGGAAAPRSSRSIRWAAVAVGLVMALLVVLLITRKTLGDDQTSEDVSPVVGKQAPALNGNPIVGKAFDIGTNDRWLLVNFFATWCVPCIQEHPQLRAFSEEHRKDGLAQVVSVEYGDTAPAVKKFFEANGGTWTVLDSDHGRTALDWGVAKVPESFLVAPSGVVVQRFNTGNGVTKNQLDDLIAQYEKQSQQATATTR